MNETNMTQLASPQQWWQYGVLGIAVLVFAFVIVFLFKRYEKREDKIAEERKEMTKKEAAWELREEKIRSEYEEKMAAISEACAERVISVLEDSREHEDKVRREFFEELKHMSEAARLSNAALSDMLNKLSERVTTRRS